MPAVAAVEAPNIVNGIDVDAVRALAGYVQNEPTAAQTHWQVTNTWKGRTHNQAKVNTYAFGGHEIARDFTIDIDEPVELGGGDQFANPQEHLIAALNACMMVSYTALCALHGIELEKLEITTQGDIDIRGFLGLDASVTPGFENLDYTITIKGDASEEEFHKIHELVMVTSPNFHNLSQLIPLNPTFIIE